MSTFTDDVAFLLTLDDERLLDWAREARHLAAKHGDVCAGALAALHEAMAARQAREGAH